MLLFTQLGFAQWTKIGNDIDGEAANDYFGDLRQLAISGDGSVVAISSDQNSNNNNGYVKVYKNINSVWTLINDKINGTNSGLGSEIELSKNGNIIAIGDPGNDNIRILKNENNIWTQKGSNNINDIYNANIGQNLAMNADGTVLATTLNNKIIIFKLINNNWTLNKEIILSGDRNFLASAFIEFNDLGDILVVGNRQYNGNNDGTEDGRVLIYENINNDWYQKGSSIISNNNESYFGSSVDISGDGSLIVVGSPHTTVNGKDQAGFARAYKFENNNWVQVGSDINGLVDDINIGRSVSLNIDGTILAVGGDGRASSGTGRGIAQIFKFENNDWVQIHSTIIGEASKDAFGSSIAINDSGSIVAIGGSDNDANGSNSGHARVYENSTATTSNYTSIPDANFEQYLVQNNIDSDGTIDGQVLTADIVNVTQVDVSQKNITDLTGIQNFTSLTYLNAFDNNITSIDVSKNILLENLYLSDNQLTTIDITQNTKLIEFGIYQNQLTSVDISKNTELTHLFVALNQLTNIDISNNTKLKDVRCEANQLSSLDVSLLSDLELLWIFNNKITQIDVSNNIKLKTFTAYENMLTSLDVSKNVNLEVVQCYSNQLTSLNVRNNNNAKIIDFEAQQNPNLLCINVDDKAISDNNNNWTKDSAATFLETCGEGTFIPDVNFETYIESLGFGNTIVGDGYVDTNQVAAITTLNIGNKSIADLTGIEDFVALTELIARDNSINNIDLSKNINLENLDLFTNTLSTIDVSKNTKLKELHLGTNQLTNIDVSMLPDLTKLWCFNNQLSTLDVSNNSLLEVLNSSTNQLSSINLSSNINLEVLYTDNNNLALLDLSTNGKLVQLTVTNNQLNSLNVKNGNNTNINIFFTTGNSSLTCIEVDDATYSESTWNDVNATWNAIDAQHTFNIECPKYTSIPDANFEAYLESINVGNGIANDKLVNKESIQVLTILNIADKNIADITGIEDFSSLVELDARNNTITQVDLSKNTSLEKLYLANNQITSIDFSNNTSLKIIDVGENQLTDIDVHLLTDLESLSCYKNQLSNTNLYSNKNLLAFIANENQLKAVDIRENKNLFWIDVDDNLLENLTIKNGNNTKITTFSATGNPNLTCIEVDDITFSNTNWTNKDAQSTFSTDCAPANDDCSNAIPLTFGQQTPGDVNSGNANNNPTCATGNVIADVWFSVVVPDTGEFAIQGSSFGGQLKFAIYQSCASVAPIACGTSISLKNLTIGTKFYLKVWLEGASKNTNQTDSGTFTITAQESSVLSVDDFTQADVKLMLYPNPASTFINIKMSDNSEINNIEINNLIGKRVLFEKIDNDRNLLINISNLSKGVYFIRTKTEHKIISKKLIIN